ncbi:DUF1501 domain-containing protein [Prosthecobacter dejongeii]|uniref:Tat (Twin-arginine translocation) pathway signal sequence n=1 Tax=Prosthecobacter dejongeii TaxID=48465 RepID=A0A7W7YHK0_9BACT|nr:DUF1501 domain-containing protein [Prosthecobacter dejongeii]MBB5036262.1 hypothetical protein [Prosthecobacter dejongeii]
MFHTPTFYSRRHFLRDCTYGLGKVAAAGLLTDSLSGAAAANPLSARGPHFAPKAKRVIHLFMAGAPSQLETFDPKPMLTKYEGKPIPPEVIGGQRYAFIRSDAAALGPRFKFAQHGQSGAWISEVMPHVAKIADELCIIRSVKTDQFNHAPAQIFFQTGFGQPGRPCMGSWALYGLGAETQNLPAFVVMSTGSGLSGGTALMSSGFLPTIYNGVRFRNSGDPILNVSSPAGIDSRAQRDTLDLVSQLNQKRLGAVGDPEIATRIASYEMAFRMQTSAPELTDLRSESKETLEMYGCDPDKPSYARACLLARRMIERGVRFVNIYHEGWDAHSNVEGNVRNNCKETDQASAALVKDLKQRGLLDDTLVVWGGEFGRTPMVETNPALGRALGRDHHPQAFTIWMAGGGVKGGQTIGATDELGFNVVEDPVHVHDVQATMLHLMGFDHERLTFHTQGRDYRLTDVHGHVVKKVLLKSRSEAIPVPRLRD